MKPGKNLIISFVLILFFSLYFFVLSYRNKAQSEFLNNWLVHTQLVIEEITDLNILITEFEAVDQNNVITNNKDSDKDLALHYSKGSSKFNKIKNLTADNKLQQQKLQQLSKILQKKTQYVNNVFDVLKKSQPAALLLLGHPESKKLYDDIKSILASMLQNENILLKKRTAEYDQALQTRFNYSIAFAILGFISFIIICLKTYRESINRKIANDEAQKSETKYKELIEKSSLIIFTSDLHGRFTFISDKCFALTGYKTEELLGKHYDILIPENHKKDIAEFYLNQYKNFTKDLLKEFEIKTKNNQIKVVKLSTVLIEKRHKIVGFQSIARDVTEVKQVESLIKESEIKLQQQQEEYNLRMQSVINNIPMILYIKDLEGRYVMINKNFTDILGINDEMVIGRKNIEIEYFAKNADFYDSIDKRVKITGKPIEFEEVKNTKQGERNFLVTKFPLLDKNNDIFAISSIAKDITDNTNQRQLLINARLKAEKAEQLQEAFLANMSHEIRTPMNGIMGMTNMLIDTDLNEEQKEYADLIKKSSDTLLVLINDILDLSKIKAGRMELEAIDFNVKEAVQNVLLPMKVSLKKNVVLNCVVHESVPAFVKGDSHKLFQILNNLVSNALKFTEKGEVRIDVTAIKKTDEQIFIQFNVSDTGIGISGEHIKNIFENFTQAGTDTVRRFGGTGLGLAITKKLTELQNGTISVESVPWSGSVFHVEIPYLLSDVKQTGLPKKNNIDIDLLREGIENKKILIVEDNAVNQRVLTSVLQKIKARWEVANNGKEAVDKLENGSVYDLIIMDLQMPVMDGFQAAEYIRSKLKITTPIIAMTASTLRNEKAECFNIGMNDYLAKPFSPDELIKRINSLINSITIKEKQMDHEQSAEKIYDLAYLHELEDTDYLIEMLELFFETVAEALHEIDDNVKNKNWDATYKSAHKLKSSLGPLQISKMIKTASAIEENAKYGKNLDEIPQLNKELQMQYAIVKPMIEAELVKAKETAEVS